MITLYHQQNRHVFADGHKNMYDIFNNYVCSASHMRPGLHFQNFWREPCWLIKQPYVAIDLMFDIFIWQKGGIYV